MPQIPSRVKTSPPETEFDKTLEEGLQFYSLKLAELLNKGLKFTDNFNAAEKNVSDTGSADTEFSIAHGLGRTPTGFIVTDIDKAGVVYNSGTAWTATTIYLKCNVANCNVDILIY